MPRTTDRFSRLRALEPARPSAAPPDRPRLCAPDEEDALAQLLGAGVAGNHFGEHLAIRNWYSTPEYAEPSAITLDAGDGGQPAVVLAFGGRPIGQPVAMGGPFVMNTKAEIYQAFQDYRSGKFGPVPRQARLQDR